ncbi:MAG: hypothetical protein ACOCUW_00780 [Gemmatimonadota bacterium]
MAEAEEVLRIRVHVELIDRDDPTTGRAQTHVVVTPDPFYIQPGAALLIESRHPVGVRFVGATPLVGPFRDPSTGLPDGWPGPEPTTRHWLAQFIREDGARADYYKYIVAVERDGQVHIADPENVVESDPRARGGG